MKRVWAHVLGGLALLSGAVAAFVACTHDNSTLFIQDVLAPPQHTAGQICSYTSDPTQPYISSGTLDVALANAYTPTFLVGNQSDPQVNASQLRTETATITIEGAIVRITDVSGAQIKTFTRLTSGTAYPSTGTTPGYIPISVETIDPQTVSQVAGNLSASDTVRVVTYTRFFGHNLGGTYVESGEFEFPVDICNGCLISFGTADINPLCPFPNCVNALSTGAGSSTSATTAPCIPGQDQPIDCSLCLGTAACRGAVQQASDCPVLLDAGGGG